MTSREAIKKYNAGDHDTAIRLAISAIDEKPQDAERYALLATMLIGVQAYAEAGELLQKAQGLFPDNAEILYNRGLLAYAQEQYQLAITYLQKIENDPVYRGDATYMIALSYKRLNDSSHALAFALTAQENDPTRPDAALLAAQLLLGLGVFEQAKQLLKPFLKMNDAQILFTYAMVQSALGEDGSASLDAAKKLAPERYREQSNRVRDIAGVLKQGLSL